MAVQEFRFVGVGRGGQPVQVTVFAPRRKAAHRKVATLSEQHNYRPGGVQQRRIYQYKARLSSGRVITGEQKAFSEEEIATALKKIRLEVVAVRKKLIAAQTKPTKKAIVIFARL